MSNVAILIALFIASQHTTHHNCSIARDALIRVAVLDSQTSVPVHADEDLQLIKQFVIKQCKDGVKRK